MRFQEMSVADILQKVKETGGFLTEDQMNMLREDNRAGVRKIYQQLCRQRVLEEKERLRIDNMYLYEKEARRKGAKIIAGVDEAGRGPLAGPVVAAAAILPESLFLPGINDSKKLSAAKRETLYSQITDMAMAWSVGIATVEEIDSINILNASLLAMQRAVLGLQLKPEYILVDALEIPGIEISQLPIVKGDGKSVSIAAASIIAKVTRDRIMDDLHKEFPDYGFGKHKGYATKDHIEAIKKYGQCPLHRKTFTKNFMQMAINDII